MGAVDFQGGFWNRWAQQNARESYYRLSAL